MCGSRNKKSLLQQKMTQAWLSLLQTCEVSTFATHSGKGVVERGFQINCTNSRVNIHLLVFTLNSVSRFYPRIPKEAECYHLPFLGEAAETQKDEKVLCSRAAVHRQSQKQSQERILSGCKVVRSCTAVCGPRFLRALDFCKPAFSSLISSVHYYFKNICPQKCRDSKQVLPLEIA